MIAKRKPATVAEVLIEEFMEPMGLTQATLAAALSVQRQRANVLCSD